MQYAINFVDSTVKTFPTPEEREACMDRLRANGLYLNEDYTLADIPDDTTTDHLTSLHPRIYNTPRKPLHTKGEPRQWQSPK